jgi:hypothetical protein
MIRWNPMKRKLLPPIFALLIFAAHLHCVLGHGHAMSAPAAEIGTTQTNSPLTPVESNDCEHATGCICKGATLADEFVAGDIEISTWNVELFVLDHVAFEVVPPIELNRTSRPPDGLLPLRVLTRCALLQSFLI